MNQGHIPRYLRQQGIDKYKGISTEDPEHPWEIGEIWLADATDQQLKEFKEWAIENVQGQGDYFDPPTETLDYRDFVKPTWLVHFTDDPWEIWSEGFAYGHEDYHGLHLTTHKRERKKSPGFNFAFLATSRDAENAAHGRYGDPKYGEHAVVFWGSGVGAMHWGDEEYQVIVHGPSVNKDRIFPITHASGSSWIVESQNNRPFKEDSFKECVEWIINNYRMLQNVYRKNG